jgi:hypothetical protein
MHLLLAAVGLMLLGVALRRLVLPRGLFAKLLPARLRRSARPAPAHDASATLDALTTRKAAGGATVAPEIARAQAAKGAAPAMGARHAGPPASAAADPETSGTEAPPPPAATPPSSLAEQLLAKKKRRP